MSARMVIGLVLAACGSTDDAGGTLICKDGDRTFTVAVAPGTLADVRAHAEAASFTDCDFDTKPIARLEPPKRELRLPDLPNPPPPPPPPPTDPADDPGVIGGVMSPQTPPRNIPPTVLEGHRISGDKNILPEEVTKLEIQRSGKDKVVGSYKLCVDSEGEVSKVSQLKSTGFATYDQKLMREMRGWRFRPYLINGLGFPVCTAFTFIYAAQ